MFEDWHLFSPQTTGNCHTWRTFLKQRKANGMPFSSENEIATLSELKALLIGSSWLLFSWKVRVVEQFEAGNGVL